MRRSSFLLACVLAAPAWAQHRPGDSPQSSGQRVATSGDISRYTAMYGSPEFRSLDTEFTEPWPPRRAIRTIGRVSQIPGKTGRAPMMASGPLAPRYDSETARYQLCGERVCVAVTPVEEVREAWESLASVSLGEALEVVGAVEGVPKEGQAPGGASPKFLVWQGSEALKATTRREGVAGSTLEPLVRYPKAAAGRIVTVSGTFRGANLFADLPADSRRSEDDWVLRDGPFSIWITGKDPKGDGFALDTRSKADCRYRLQVQGEIRIENEYIYLRAKKIQLLGRASID